MFLGNFLSKIRRPVFLVHAGYSCDTMGGICFCGCGCQLEDPFVCFGAKPTQRSCTRDFPRDWKNIEGIQQKRAEQKKPVDRAGQSREHDSQQERAGVRACGLRVRFTNMKEWVRSPGWLCGNFARIHARDSLQKRKSLGKCHKLLPSRAWS